MKLWQRPSLILVLLISWCHLCGCNEEDRLPCPANGLGVATAGGKLCSKPTELTAAELASCLDQMENYKRYDCTGAQICPDHGIHAVHRYVVDPLNPSESLSFILTNCSVGGEALVISKVQVTGDTRCYFSHSKDKDIDNAVIQPGKTAVVRARYRPVKVGEDHAHLRIYSNARNYDPLILPICGRAVAKTAPGKDACVSPADARWDGCPGKKDAGKKDAGKGDGQVDGDLSSPLDIFSADASTTLWCKDVGAKVEDCHK